MCTMCVPIAGRALPVVMYFDLVLENVAEHDKWNMSNMRR